MRRAPLRDRWIVLETTVRIEEHARVELGVVSQGADVVKGDGLAEGSGCLSLCCPRTQCLKEPPFFRGRGFDWQRKHIGVLRLEVPRQR